ncbi:MAG: HD domain-containing protein [Firmicutes bacterium]|nr:HD domain-containing protein [Bacillota bacterium]
MVIMVPPAVEQACAVLRAQGFQAYLVGGAIRDSLLGLVPTDWDIATDAVPEQVEAVFTRSLPTGKRFGTVTVFVHDTPIEVTTMRSDGPYSDQRRPDYIIFTDQLELDLARRDFTINALGYDPLAKRIIDPFQGRKHLKRKILATVGDPSARFREDPLRMLRLIRFQSTLGFKVHKDTERVLPSLAGLIAKVSPERMLAELNKMLMGRELLSALETFAASTLMEVVLPELAACCGLCAGEHHPYDLLTHACTAAHFAHPLLHLRWAALLHDVGKQRSLGRDHAELGASLAEQLLRRLRASTELIAKVSALITHHMFDLHPHSSDRAWRRFLGRVGVEATRDLIKLRQADMAGMNASPRQILAYGQAMEARLNDILTQDSALSLKDLRIDGRQLMQELDLQPGPLVGQLLHYLLEQVWEDPELNQRETLVRLAAEQLKCLRSNGL